MSKNCNTVGICTSSKGEDCYRTQVQEAYYLSHYTDNSLIGVTVSECCLLECNDIFGSASHSTVGGCGSDNIFYSSLIDFCVAYCGNRTLSYTWCGSPNCGTQQGCLDPCVALFPNRIVCSLF